MTTPLSTATPNRVIKPTDAGTDSNTQRAVAGSLSDLFYTLQLKITLDDDTGNSEDIRIESISIIYSIDV